MGDRCPPPLPTAQLSPTFKPFLGVTRYTAPGPPQLETVLVPGDHVTTTKSELTSRQGSPPEGLDNKGFTNMKPVSYLQYSTQPIVNDTFTTWNRGNTKYVKSSTSVLGAGILALDKVVENVST